MDRCGCGCVDGWVGWFGHHQHLFIELQHSANIFIPVGGTWLCICERRLSFSKVLFAGNEGFTDVYGWWASAIISSSILLRWVFRWLLNDYSILYFLTTGQTSFHFLFINLFMGVCFALLKMELTASGVLGKLSTSQMHPSPYKPSQSSLLNLFIFTASWPI